MRAPPLAPRYARDPRIHTFGNVGLGGGLHAALAPLATLLITRVAYAGADPRAWLHAQPGVVPGGVVDLGCGTGTSTLPGGVGVDTSAQMIGMARLLSALPPSPLDPAPPPSTRFDLGNAETWGVDDAHQACTICFVLHEMPRAARLRTLLNAARISTRAAYALDICPNYSPSPAMRAGEPYVDDYLAHIEHDVHLAARLSGRVVQRTDVIPGHVVCWTLLTPAAARPLAALPGDTPASSRPPMTARRPRPTAPANARAPLSDTPRLARPPLPRQPSSPFSSTATPPGSSRAARA